MADRKFPKSARLGSKTDFRAILSYKLFEKNELMTIYAIPNDVEIARIAVSVKAKITSAVGRNRLKRLTREAFRLNKDRIPAGFDYLIIFSPRLSRTNCCDISKLTLVQVKDSLLKLTERLQRRFEKRQAKN